MIRSRRRIPPLSSSTFEERRSARLAISSARSIAAGRSAAGTRYRWANTSRFCSTVSETSRLSSWGTTPILARACLESSGSRQPSTSSSPSSAITWAVSAFIVVDLPAPLGPSRPTQDPTGRVRSRPPTAVSSPNRFTKPRIRIASLLLSCANRISW